MKLLCSIISLCVLACLSLNLTAQKIQITQSDYESEHYERKFFKLDGERYLAMHYKSPLRSVYKAQDDLMLLDTYDKNMRFLGTKTVTGLEDKQCLGASVAGSKLFVVSRDRNSGKVMQYEIDPATGKMLEKQDLCNTVEGKAIFIYKDGKSANGKFHYVVTRNRTEGEKTYEYHGAVLDENRKVINRFNFYTDDYFKGFLTCEPFITNDGLLFILRAREGSSGKSDYNPVENHISQISRDGKHTESMLGNLPEGSFTNISWILSGNEMRFVGTLSPRSAKGFTRLVSGVFDPVAKRVRDVKETDLTAITDIAGASPQTLKYFSEKGISEEAELVKTFPLKNGGAEVILEIHRTQQAGIHANGGVGVSITGMNGFSGSSPRFYAKSVYVLQFDNQCKLNWIRVLTKYQEEISHSFYIGTMSTLDENESLHIIFHDNKDNDDIDVGGRMAMGLPGGNKVGMAAVSIKSNGSYKKQFYLPDGNVFRKFATEHYEETAPGEIVFDHYNSFGKMLYGLGKLTVSE